MRGCVSLLLTFYACGLLRAQEFKLHRNGLIYSDSTIALLKNIVDSLNLKFLVCGPPRQYLVQEQALGHYVYLESSSAAEAEAALMAGISVEDFAKKYPAARIEKDLLFVRERYKSYGGKNMVSFKSVTMASDDKTLTLEDGTGKYLSPLSSQWIWRYHKQTGSSQPWLEALYSPRGFTTATLPEKYARMVQYADCMIDTAARIYTGKGDRADKPPVMVSDFYNYMNAFLRKPSYDYKGSAKDYEAYLDLYTKWHKRKWQRVDSLHHANPRFITRLNAALTDARHDNYSDAELEAYAGRYISRKDQLAMMRSRRVYGTCSQDNAPREHAFSIALLSAETTSWEIFLRAHLDIMNDRFDRRSDGSYAWGTRMTYLKELEMLEINVTDLLLGTVLRLQNPSSNHYSGNISRIGRAIAESARKDEFESAMRVMITDNSLDSYNRVLICYLYKIHISYHKEKEERSQKERILKEAVKTMPAYLSDRLLAQKNRQD